MSAPEHAKAIDPTGNNMAKKKGEEGNYDLGGFYCAACGYRGKKCELLGVDGESTLWCPICRTNSVIFD